ncbi:unnamed protein product [Amoebophrya sp. A25]|nr:unnamed protein product [Amoebophrya sp. A25]|eukprot:GSA25T00024714001.1
MDGYGPERFMSHSSSGRHSNGRVNMSAFGDQYRTRVPPAAAVFNVVDQHGGPQPGRRPGPHFGAPHHGTEHGAFASGSSPSGRGFAREPMRNEQGRGDPRFGGDMLPGQYHAQHPQALHGFIPAGDPQQYPPGMNTAMGGLGGAPHQHGGMQNGQYRGGGFAMHADPYRDPHNRASYPSVGDPYRRYDPYARPMTHPEAHGGRQQEPRRSEGGFMDKAKEVAKTILGGISFKGFFSGGNTLGNAPANSGQQQAPYSGGVRRGDFYARPSAMHPGLQPRETARFRFVERPPVERETEEPRMPIEDGPAIANGRAPPSTYPPVRGEAAESVSQRIEASRNLTRRSLTATGGLDLGGDLAMRDEPVRPVERSIVKQEPRLGFASESEIKQFLDECEKDSPPSSSKPQKWQSAAASSAPEDSDEEDPRKKALYSGLVVRLCQDHQIARTKAHALLDKYAGKEAELFVRLCDHFHTEAAYYLKLETGLVVDDRYDEQRSSPPTATTTRTTEQSRTRKGSYSDTLLGGKKEEGKKLADAAPLSAGTGPVSSPGSTGMPSFTSPAVVPTSTAAPSTIIFGSTSGMTSVKPVASAANGAAAVSIFGSATGNGTSSAPSASTVNNIFGASGERGFAPKASPETSIFGQAAAISTTTASTTTNIFGGSGSFAAPTTAGTSMFGAPGANNSSSMFGGPAPSLRKDSFTDTSVPLPAVPEETAEMVAESPAPMKKEPANAESASKLEAKTKLAFAPKAEPAEESEKAVVAKTEYKKETNVEGPAEKASSSAENKGPPDGEKGPESGKDRLTLIIRNNIDAIYRKKNPKKLGGLDALMEKYNGKETALYKKVCGMYDVPFLDSKGGIILTYASEGLPDEAEMKEGDGDGAGGEAESTAATASSSSTSIFGAAPPPGGGLFGDQGGMFSASASTTTGGTTGLFGTGSTLFGGAGSSGGLFGAKPDAAAGEASKDGNSTSAAGTSSIFGSAAGGEKKSDAAAKNIFGAAPSTSGTSGETKSSDIFGALASGGDAKPSIFGNAPESSKSTSIFGAASGDAKPNIFSAPAASSADAKTNIFGASTAAPTKSDEANKPTSGGIFGGALDANPTTVTTSSIFGKPAEERRESTSTGILEKKNEQTSTSASTSAGATSNIFGGACSGTAAGTATTATTSNIFGGTASGGPDVTAIFGPGRPSVSSEPSVEGSTRKPATKRRSIFEATDTNASIFKIDPNAMFSKAPTEPLISGTNIFAANKPKKTSLLSERKKLISAAAANAAKSGSDKIGTPTFGAVTPATAGSSKETGDVKDPAAPSAASNIFGKPANGSAASQPGGGGIFGGGLQAGESKSPGGGIFGAPPKTSASSIFGGGGSIFGGDRNAFGGQSLTERFGADGTKEPAPVPVFANNTKPSGPDPALAAYQAKTAAAGGIQAIGSRKRRAEDDIDKDAPEGRAKEAAREPTLEPSDDNITTRGGKRSAAEASASGEQKENPFLKMVFSGASS